MDQAVLETLELNKVSSFTYGEILLNLSLAFILGMIISYVYKITHGLGYSQSFILTIVFVTVIVSMVIMVIENNLARALLGGCSFTQG